MDYLAPKTLNETLILLRNWRDKATLVAGGTNVIPDLRGRSIRPEVLIDISHLKSLSYIKEDRNKIRVGALTTISELASSEVIQKGTFLLSQACNQLGNPLVRNRATLAGNLADASPAADTAVPLLVLDAIVRTERDGGKHRQIPIGQFFLGPNQTVFKKDEQNEH